MPRPLRLLPLALLFAGTLFAPRTVSALDCGERLVVNGDRAAYVRAFCGEPLSVVTNTVTRARYGGGAAAFVTIQVETWLYDFGPSRLMVELAFENGVLVYERTLSRGTALGHPPDGPANGAAVYTRRDSRAYRRR